MKILYITANLDSHTGWGRYSLGVINEMRARGHDVAVLTQNELAKPKSIFDFIRNSHKSRIVVRDYDIVHALDVWPFAIYAWLAVLLSNKKLFINLVGTYSVAPLSHMFKRLLIGFAFRRANHIFAISHYVANLVHAKIKTNKISVVYLGLTPLPNPSDSDIKWVKNLIGERTPILLTVGTVEVRKGQKEVAEATRLLVNKYPEILYIMAGVNSDKAYLDSIGKGKNILYTSSADTDGKLAALYSLCDVFLLPSGRLGDHVEGFGLVAIEAASFGKPIIGTSDSGVAEAMQDGYNGYAVHSSNLEMLTAAIDEVLRGDRGKLSNHSLEFAARFRWEKTVDKYCKEY